MKKAGLTHGGFYKHFSAKEDLYEAAVLQFACNDQPEPWQAHNIDPAARGEALARMIVEAYLSDEHFEDRDRSCPMIALPSDVSRGNGRRPSRERALALVAQVVGGMVLARAMDDAAIADEIRDSTRKQVFETAGWEAE